MATQLLNEMKSGEESLVTDEEDEAGSETRPINPGTEESNVTLGEYIPLKNNYSSMGDTPTPRPPTSVSGSSDLLGDDRSTSDRGTDISDKSIDASLFDLARDGEATRLKAVLEDLQKKYENNPSKFEDERDRRNKYGYSALHLAARYNRKNCVTHILNSGADIDQSDGEDGNTPLLLAAKYNMASTLKLLLKRKANAVMRNTYGTSALHFACRRGNFEACGMLLNVPGVVVNARDNAEQTPLHMAMLGGSKQVAKLLIDKGADVFVTDIEGEGPIHFAAGEDNHELICTLTHGAIKEVAQEDREALQRRFVNLPSNEKDTALHMAAQAGYEATVRTLVTIGADVNVTTDTKATPLHLAAISGQIKIVRYLVKMRAKLNAMDDDQMTPLHRACQYGRLEVVKFLRSQKARIDVKDRDNYSPLMCAVWKGQNEVVKYLLEHDAKIYLTDSSGKTVLHIAVEEDHVDTLELLLTKKEAVNLIDNVDKENKSALHYAAIGGNKQAIYLLINNNASVDLDDREDMSPIHYAAKYGHVSCVNALTKKNAGSVIHSTDRKGRGPLHHAAINGHIDVCEALMNKGAESSCRDDISWTPLDYAAQNGHHKTMKILIENDADVDAVDKNNSSPLHHAAKNGSVDAINLLLDNGASISLRNKDGKNCLDIAAENFNKEACLGLVQHPRWMEALQSLDKDTKQKQKKKSTDSLLRDGSFLTNDQYPLEKLIEVAPDVAYAVLDRCVTKSALATTHKDYHITYNFDLLDKLPKKGVGTKYFAPDTMVHFKREGLLSHPVIVKLVRYKWGNLGRWINLANFLTYLVFIVLLTALILTDKRHSKDQREKNQVPTCRGNSNAERFTTVIPWITIAFAFLQIIKEIVQMFVLRLKYFKEFVNDLETLLYISTVVFMFPFLLCQTGGKDATVDEDVKWTAGAIAILLGWVNFLMYLKHLPLFGLYIAMFSEVMQSLVKVLVVFSILILAFVFSFYALLDVQPDFQNPGLSIVSVIVKMIGELEYDGIFTENFAEENKYKLPYKAMTMVIFILFICAMTIVVMNLLVGLAVGDIESVRKSAFLRILKDEVRALRIFERNCPMFLLRRHHLKVLVDYPNQRGFVERILEWLQKYDSETMQDEQNESAGIEHDVREEVDIQKTQIVKQKQKMKSLVSMIEDQRDKYRKVARKLGILDD